MRLSVQCLIGMVFSSCAKECLPGPAFFDILFDDLEKPHMLDLFHLIFRILFIFFSTQFSAEEADVYS